MAQTIELEPVADVGDVGFLVLPRTIELAPVLDEGDVELVDLGRAYGPTATTPYPGEPGGSPVSLSDPSGLRSPSAVLPDTAVQLVEADLTHVAWVANYDDTSFRVAKEDPGMGTVQIQRGHPLAGEFRFPRQLRFFDAGQIQQRALIEPQDHKSVDQAEEAGQNIAYQCQGVRGLLGRMALDPIDYDLQPVQDAMSFSFAHPAYPAAGGWAFCRDVGTYGRPTDWPGYGANIWGPSGTHTFAPGGRVYCRGPLWYLDEAQVLAFPWHVDNVGRLLLDGAEIDALGDFNDANNFRKTHEKRYFVSAGWHMLAVSAFNQGPNVPGPLGNPGSFRVTVRKLRSNGQLGALVHATSTAWRAYEYLSARPPGLQRPGWTAGMILNYLLDRDEAITGRVVARTFDNYRDSGRRLWPNILDFTAPIWDNLLQITDRLSETHCDLQWAPGSDTINAWVKDTHGATTTAPLVDGYSDQIDGCITSLTHKSEPPLATEVGLRWAGGWTHVVSVAAVAAWGYIRRKVSIPMVTTGEAADRIGAQILAVFGHERVQSVIEIKPRHPSQRPGIGYTAGDTVPAPNRDMVLENQRVQAWTKKTDANGHGHYTIETGDVIFDQAARLDTWLKSTEPGTLGGRTQEGLPYRQTVFPESSRRRRLPLIFDHDPSDDTGESRWFTVDDDGTIDAITVTMPGGEGGDFELLVNGATVWSASVPPGVSYTERELQLDLVPGDVIAASSPDAIGYTLSARIS